MATTNSGKRYEEHDTVCKSCNKLNNILTIDKRIKQNNNRFTLSYVCEHCNEKALIRITNCGFYIMHPYVDIKKKSKVAKGWVRQKWYRNSNTNYESRQT